MQEPVKPGKLAGRRGRPPGRSANQQRQWQGTRESILTAAADIFAAKLYAQATIDELIGAAGVSRATFYDHFDSKLALAMTIYDGIVDDWLEHYDKLAESHTRSGAALIGWIEDLADMYSAHGFVTPLVEHLALFEAPFRNRLARDRDMLIARLAERSVPGFAAAIGDSHEIVLQRTRMQLLLMELDRVCGMVSLPNRLAAGARSALIQVIAARLIEAFNEPGKHHSAVNQSSDQASGKSGTFQPSLRSL